MLLTASLSTDLLVLTTSVILLIYVFFHHKFSFWSKKGIQTLPPSIPFGTNGNPKTRKDPFYVTLATTYKRFKDEGHDHAGYFMMTTPYYIPIKPEYIKSILLKDFQNFVGRGLYYNEKDDPLSAHLFNIGGEKWRKLRVKMTPTFTSGKMKMMYQTLVDCSVPLAEEISKLEKAKEPIDIKELLGCFSTDVIGSCAFGIECNSFKHPDAEFRKYGKKAFEFNFVKTLIRLAAIMFPEFCRKIGVYLLPRDVTNFFINAVKSTVDYRETNNFSRNDFMQLLIDMRKNTGNIDIKEMAAQAFVFFIAGFETSSTTMTYCLYELAKHQDIQEKVRKEIRETRKKNGGELGYEEIMGMKYLGQVIDETSRKHPAVPFLSRVCTEDYQLPGSDIVLHKGTNVMIATFGLHRDPEFFPDPEVFDPERFSDDNKHNIQPFTFLPFGEGPRNCIGMRFGLMQTRVGLTSILENYKLTLNPSTPDELTIDGNSFVMKSNETIYLDAVKV